VVDILIDPRRNDGDDYLARTAVRRGHGSLATTDIYLSHIAPKQVIDAISTREWSI